MNRRDIISVATIVLVVSSLAVGYYFYTLETQFQKNPEETIFVTLVIDYSGVKQNENHSGLFDKGTTVFEVTSYFSKLETKNYSKLGILVEGINGVKSNVNITNYYWFYYVDGVLGDRASNFFNLENNATVMWEYKAFSG